MSEKVLLITGASSDVGDNLISKIYKDYDYIIAHHIGDDEKPIKWKEKLGKNFLVFGFF